MYQAFFGLTSDPFRLDPNLDFIYTSKAHQGSIAHLGYGIEQGEDFVLITGAIGTGKTLALHFLLDQITTSYQTAFINVTRVNFYELLKMILSELGLEFDRRGDRADFLDALKKYLHQVRRRREKVLLVIDEAQNLDVETLEGIRLLANLAQPGDQVLQMIFAGQPGLVRTIHRPELMQLRQRIRVRYHLNPLAPDEVGPYISHRLSIAGCEKSLFSKQAVEKICRLSLGIPRLVNQCADRAMLAAFAEKVKVIGPNHVKEDEDSRVDPHGNGHNGNSPSQPLAGAEENPWSEAVQESAPEFDEPVVPEPPAEMTPPVVPAKKPDPVAPVEPPLRDWEPRPDDPSLFSLFSDEAVDEMVERAFEVDSGPPAEAGKGDEKKAEAKRAEAKRAEANKASGDQSPPGKPRGFGRKGGQTLFSILVLFLVVVVSLSVLADRLDLISFGSSAQNQPQEEGQDVGFR